VCGCFRDGPGDSLSGGRLMSDFDMMLERRRSEQRKRRKKKDIDLINDNDDAIARLIADMRLAARQVGAGGMLEIILKKNTGIVQKLKRLNLKIFVLIFHETTIVGWVMYTFCYYLYDHHQ
jgi:phosphatidylserine/phosphatidylglycerophosphate/cardiolipin synthase-like enzyme